MDVLDWEGIMLHFHYSNNLLDTHFKKCIFLTNETPSSKLASIKQMHLLNLSKASFYFKQQKLFQQVMLALIQA
jgi:hypothetical protein